MVNQGILDDAERRSGFGRMTGPITAVSQAVGLGAGTFSDELVDKVVGGKSGDALRAISKAQAEERPGETMALQAGTGLAEGYGLARRVPQLADALTGSRRRGLLQSTLTGGAAGLATGGIGGAVSGARTSRSWRRSFLQAAKEGAKTGGAIGLGFGVAAPTVASAGRNIAEIIRRSDVPFIAATLENIK